MSSYNTYTLFLCFVMFSALTGMLSFLIVSLVRYYLRLVKLGAEDESLKIEYEKETAQKSKRSYKVIGCISWILTLSIVVVAFTSFAVSLFVESRSTSMVGDIPALKVVKTNSMSYKNPENEYLFDKGLDNQINTFDLIVLHELPAEEELEIYDIVAYERDGMLILHRIVNIEEPNEEHPNARYFLLQGDAIEYHDKFPVLYEDMKGIYQDERIAFVGSFFMFMQSPVGFLCILLIIFAMIATPIAENKIKKAKSERYSVIFSLENLDDSDSDEESSQRGEQDKTHV